MALMAYQCPNCGAAYNPSKYTCEYCGSYIIMSNENFLDLSKKNFEIKEKPQVTNHENTITEHPGIYVFGRLLGKGEQPILLGVANYYTGIVSAGGKLLLTNKSLSFSAHAFNVGKKMTVIDLSTVIEAKVILNLAISQTISVKTTKGNHKFVVYHGKDWVEKILEAKRNYSSAPAQPAATTSAAPIPTASIGDYTEELRRLKQLLDEGIITEEEYNIKKRMLLGI